MCWRALTGDCLERVCRRSRRAKPVRERPADGRASVKTASGRGLGSAHGRRADRCIGLAVRKGQAEGRINKHGDQRSDQVHEADLRSPKEFFSNHSENSDTYAMTDGVTDEQFEAAIAAAKAEVSGSAAAAEGVQHLGSELAVCTISPHRASRASRSGRAPTRNLALTDRSVSFSTGCLERETSRARGAAGGSTPRRRPHVREIARIERNVNLDELAHWVPRVGAYVAITRGADLPPTRIETP